MLAGALLRAALVIWCHGQPLYVVDEQQFSVIAGNLAERGAYASESDELTSIRPPLYPALVAVIYQLFGVDNFTAVRIVQAILSLATVVVTYRLAGRLFDDRTALCSVAFVCFYPSLVFTTNLVLTETLFALLLMVFCLFIQSAWRSNRVAWYVAAGATLGFASLTRSVLWLFPPFLAVFLWMALKECSPSRRAGQIAAAVLAFAVVLAPWSIRNSRLQQTFVAVDVMGGRNFMMGNYEHTPLYRAWDAISVTGEESWYAVLARNEPRDKGATQGQRDKLAMRYGLRYALSHPTLTAQRSTIKFFNFWQLEREIIAGAQRGYWGVDQRIVVLLLAAVILGSYVAAMAGGIVGWFVLRPTDVRFHWFCLLVIGYVCLVHSAVFGHSRYHLPLMPLVLIYAGAAVVHRREIWRQRRSRRFCAAALTYAILAVGWVWEVAWVERARIQQLTTRQFTSPAIASETRVHGHDSSPFYS
ncbi:MAG: glycosyltransferase family 39 protein [Pirellulales bacterium]